MLGLQDGESPADRKFGSESMRECRRNLTKLRPELRKFLVAGCRQVRLVLVTFAFVLGAGGVMPLQARPAYFLADPVTGYALGGYDPVAFFVDRRPRMGTPKLEYAWRGARWLFLNEGNRAAFERSPEVYAPQFAGCGAYALAEGYATAGNPSIFAIIDNRLYFFHTAVNRFLFLVERETALPDAQANAAKTGCQPRK